MNLTASKTIRVGHSPDPDDAFMFYALANRKIPAGDFFIEHVVEEIESLNQRAVQGELAVTAVSCHAYAYLAERYIVMRSGASVGHRYGPLLIGRSGEFASHCEPAPKRGEAISGRCRGTARRAPTHVLWSSPRNDNDVKGKRIAIPGKLTTAYLVLQLYEKQFEPVFVPFDRVFDMVQTRKVDLGLVIHEGQLSYRDHRLEKILDLGQWWYEQTALPLPLGVDVIRRDLGAETIRKFADLFKQSIRYALENREEALAYALRYGRGVGREQGDRFVGMYVNDFTVDIGESGIKGFERLLEEGFDKAILPKRVKPEFA